MNKFSTVDYIIFALYFIAVSGYGLWALRRKKKKGVSGSHDFFLAEGSLTWWAIGASLIASNISAEQFIRTSGQGIIVAVWFIPVYLKNKIFTRPQFLETRYNPAVSLIMAIFWLFLYVFVNLTSILFLGALAINSLLGGDPVVFHRIIIGLSVF